MVPRGQGDRHMARVYGAENECGILGIVIAWVVASEGRCHLLHRLHPD